MWAPAAETLHVSPDKSPDYAVLWTEQDAEKKQHDHAKITTWHSAACKES